LPARLLRLVPALLPVPLQAPAVPMQPPAVLLQAPTVPL